MKRILGFLIYSFLLISQGIYWILYKLHNQNAFVHDLLPTIILLGIGFWFIKQFGFKAKILLQKKLNFKDKLWLVSGVLLLVAYNECYSVGLSLSDLVGKYPSNPLVGFIYLTLIVVLEEVFYRFLLIDFLTPKVGEAIAAIISIVAFMLGHHYLKLAGFYLIAGVVLTLLRFMYNSLGVNIVFHWILNTLVLNIYSIFAFFGFDKYDIEIGMHQGRYLLGVAFISIVLAIVCWLFIKDKRSRSAFLLLIIASFIIIFIRKPSEEFVSIDQAMDHKTELGQIQIYDADGQLDNFSKKERLFQVIKLLPTKEPLKIIITAKSLGTMEPKRGSKVLFINNLEKNSFDVLSFITAYDKSELTNPKFRKAICNIFYFEYELQVQFYQEYFQSGDEGFDVFKDDEFWAQVLLIDYLLEKHNDLTLEELIKETQTYGEGVYPELKAYVMSLE